MNDVLNNMLNEVSNDYNKTEGSFIYDSLAPVSIEIESIQGDVAEIINNAFADTATGEYLDRIVAAQGLTRKPAVAAHGSVKITGAEGAVIDVGILVASDLANYEVTEGGTIPVTGYLTVPVICQTAGTIGNVPSGAIKYFPVTIEGLYEVTNESAITTGYAEETDAELRTRYYSQVQAPATSGNAAQYKNWAKEIPGVGDARVFPLWNGNGTVKVAIIDSNKQAADADLVDAVQDYIDLMQPIGATTTVVSATEKDIDVGVSITITAGAVLADVKTLIEANLVKYFKSIAFVESYVSYAKLGNTILSTDGVLDYSNLTINSGTANIAIADTEIAVLGDVTYA